MASWTDVTGRQLAVAIAVILVALSRTPTPGVAAHAVSRPLGACPSPQSLQSAYVRSNFSLDAFVGWTPYYELAYHDVTQPKICGCQRSEKVLKGPVIYDNFTMMCPDKTGKIYISPLSFNLTGDSGVFVGHWAVAKSTRIPDTVVAVDVAYDNATGRPYYRWVLEFQCVEVAGQTAFVGVNFYSRERSDAALREMRAAATRQGLDSYMASGIEVVNHTGCRYE